MIQLVPSTETDIEQLTRWISADPYHKDCTDPIWWLTGNGNLSYRIDDSLGTTMYVRTDVESDLMRLHIQFAPESEVSKVRAIKSMVWGIARMKVVVRKLGLAGFVFQSVSPLLIQFTERKFGFKPAGNDDYVSLFEAGE